MAAEESEVGSTLCGKGDRAGGPDGERRRRRGKVTRKREEIEELSFFLEN